MKGLAYVKTIADFMFKGKGFASQLKKVSVMVMGGQRTTVCVHMDPRILVYKFDFLN